MRFLDTSRIRTCFDERIRCDDGVELSIDLYLPATPGRYPVLLNRTAADNNRAGRAGVSLPPAERWKALAAQGYIVAAADVRGRGDSQGDFVPFLNEAADGATTLAWLRRFDESDGQIGMFGSGYGAFCAWAAAVADRRVDAIVSISPFGAVGQGLLHRGGAVRLDWLFWMHLIAGRSVQPATLPRWNQVFQHAPLLEMTEPLGREDIWWRDWLEHWKPDDPYWSPLDLTEGIATLSLPGLHVSGWWDGELVAALQYYHAAKRSGAPQRLIIGPWDTAAVRRPAAHVGGFDFGPRSLLDLDETMAAFFDSILRQTTGFRDSRVFITGRNEWSGCEEWPVNKPEPLGLFLDSTLGANTRMGDGVLIGHAPDSEARSVITHNPEVPVRFQPTFAGFAGSEHSRDFTLDQAHLTSRDEVLVFTSAPLSQARTVMGTPTIRLRIRTQVPDADIYVLLSDCFPTGRDLHLAHAAVRLGTLSCFAPTEVTEVSLEFTPLAHDFLPGHRIRVCVTPSFYPLYARNLHAPDYLSSSVAALAQIELIVGGHSPARLCLPVLGGTLNV